MLSAAAASRTGDAPVARLGSRDIARIAVIAVVTVGLLASYVVPALREPSADDIMAALAAVQHAALVENDCARAGAVKAALKCGSSPSACRAACTAATELDAACRRRFVAHDVMAACVPRMPTMPTTPCFVIQQSWWPTCSTAAASACIREAAAAVVRTTTVGGESGDVALAAALATLNAPSGECRAA